MRLIFFIVIYLKYKKKDRKTAFLDRTTLIFKILASQCSSRFRFLRYGTVFQFNFPIRYFVAPDCIRICMSACQHRKLARRDLGHHENCAARQRSHSLQGDERLSLAHQKTHRKQGQRSQCPERVRFSSKAQTSAYSCHYDASPHASDITARSHMTMMEMHCGWLAWRISLHCSDMSRSAFQSSALIQSQFPSTRSNQKCISHGRDIALRSVNKRHGTEKKENVGISLDRRRSALESV